jgi:5-oxopent-3-ene-1,2,5-tricarboxylate decarboxylase/2-hydroxyhepta-2,4-diene-1,7-dioate isomerase
MRFARIYIPGQTAPLCAAVTADGSALDLGGQQLPIPQGAFAPAVDGWIYGPVLNEQSTVDRFAPQMTEKPYVAPPTVPVMYFKPKNTHRGHQASITLPAYADCVELGASVGVVFKHQIAQASADSAMDAVAGYTIVLDLSMPNPSIFRPPVQEKCFDGACPVGPWVVDKADITDPQALVIRTFVNGTCVAERTMDDMVRPLPTLIADVTEFMALSAGDTLLMGFPVGGVPTAKRGDHVRIEIDGLGALECTIAESK